MSEIIVPQDTWFNPYVKTSLGNFEKDTIITIPDVGTVFFEWGMNQEHNQLREQVFLFNGYRLEVIDPDELDGPETKDKCKIANLNPIFYGDLPETWETQIRFPEQLTNRTYLRHPNRYGCYSFTPWRELGGIEECRAAFTYDTDFVLSRLEYKIKML